jgi:hypothetical protein
MTEKCSCVDRCCKVTGFRCHETGFRCQGAYESGALGRLGSPPHACPTQACGRHVETHACECTRSLVLAAHMKYQHAIKQHQPCNTRSLQHCKPCAYRKHAHLFAQCVGDRTTQSRSKERAKCNNAVAANSLSCAKNGMTTPSGLNPRGSA